MVTKQRCNKYLFYLIVKILKRKVYISYVTWKDLHRKYINIAPNAVMSATSTVAMRIE